MKKFFIYPIIGLTMASLTGCLEEVFPSSGVTADQLQTADKEPLISAITSFLNTGDPDYSYSDIGYPGLMIWREVMTANMPVKQKGYDYYSYYASMNTLGDYDSQYNFWYQYYGLVKNCNILISVCNSDNSDDIQPLGTALTYRAMAYMDMMRLFEYKHTGVARFDDLAAQFGSFKVTVPIVTEKTSEEVARHNPRAPFYTMYRFVNDDLTRAEQCMDGVYSSVDKAHITLGVVYGMKARFWLELGSRFTIYPDDLDTQIAHESDADLDEYCKLGINSAADCFSNASKYARLALNCGYTPVTKSEWFSTTNGFNTATSAWMLGIIMGSNDPAVTDQTYFSWVSYLSPEAIYGVAGPDYKASRQIDAAIFSRIPDADWRKLTWIDPADFDSPNRQAIFASKYSQLTTLSYENWCKIGSYVGFKFRPGSGEPNNSLIGNKVDIPLMRIEEMYFIDAEATARLSGYAAGKAILESFLNVYRYEGGTYTCPATDMDSFIDELLVQRSIEFWGEGILAFDYKRLEKPIVRGYVGTNHHELYRFNSYEGYVAPWMNIFITSSETDLNTACVLNPDPSNPFPVWTE